MSGHVAKVLGMLAGRLAMAPLVHPLPSRSEPETVVPEPREFIAWIRPFGLPDRRMPVVAYDAQDARGIARKEALRLFPGRSFIVSARLA